MKVPLNIRIHRKTADADLTIDLPIASQSFSSFC